MTVVSRAAAWGVDEGYEDVEGRWHQAPRPTVDALLEAMGADREEPPPPTTVVVEAGTASRRRGRFDVETEDGGLVTATGALPPDLPLGYHRLVPLDGGDPVCLIVVPAACHLPDGLRTWGFAVQLYSLRSSGGWGMGDLEDLRRLARWAKRDLGAGTMLVNPLFAARPVLPQEPSPYYPSTRRYLNPLYLRLDDEQRAGDARAANGGRLIDRDAIWSAKLAALEAGYARFSGDDGFHRFCTERGDDLVGYATYCVLAERGTGPLPHPASAEVSRARRERADRVRFHQWVQWLLDRQLAAAAAETALVQDLPVGVDPHGADAWLWQDVIAGDVRVGAPPDEFNRAGQDWALPPFSPWGLGRQGYEPFVQTVRAALRHAGGLRVDHVMGLFRLFWIPPGADPTEGTYVRYPWRDLLGIVALESHRARAFVCGEDLGTVEARVREELARRRVLSYRLLWFEDGPPSAYPELAMAAVTTHDLPTVAGLWTGADLAEQRALGLEANEASTEAIRTRLQQALYLGDDAPVGEVVARTYELLAQAPSAILTATLEDVLVVSERPNQPGTTDEQRPNWSVALPATLEEIEASPQARRMAAALSRRSEPVASTT